MQLTRKTIIAAAVTILDTYGLADMTMRRVATSLGVAPGALYWHIANKQQLITAIAEEILARCSPTRAGHPPPSPNCCGSMLSRRDGAELVPPCRSRSRTRGRRSSWRRRCPGRDLRRIGAASLLHLVLGATALEQARAQHAADTGAEVPGDASADFRRGVDLLLTGLATSRG